MITESLSTLKIHKLSQAQYDREYAAGNLDETALYLTPDEITDDIDMKDHKITNLATPTNDTDGANKAYVDEQIATLTAKIEELLATI